MSNAFSNVLKTTFFVISLALLLTACGGEQNDNAPAESATAEPAAAEPALAEAAVETADEALAEVEDAVASGVATVEDAAEEMTHDMPAVAGSAAPAAERAAPPADDGDPCTLSVEVGDGIAYSTDAMTVPSSCEQVTVTITHTGSLPAVAMGHNWVLVPSDAVDAVAQAAMSAGAEMGYVPDDDRIVAATGVVGGGESDSVSFELDRLQDGTDYMFVCTFPGHSFMMRGSFTVLD